MPKLIPKEFKRYILKLNYKSKSKMYFRQWNGKTLLSIENNIINYQERLIHMATQN